MPAAQSSHLPEAEPENEPTGHSRCSEAPIASTKDPASASAQLDWPVASWYVLIAQLEHSLAPGPEDDPAEQLAHSLAPAAEDLPAAHFVHCGSPSAEEVPASQGVHAALLK